MKRAILLALLFAVSAGIAVPLLSSDAARDKDRQTSASSRKKVRKYSRAWWRRYQARMRKKRQNQAQARNAWRKRPANVAARQVKANHKIGLRVAPVAVPDVNAGLSVNDSQNNVAVNLPEGWTTRPVAVNGERKFLVFGPNGQPVGQASLSSAWARDAQDEGGAGRNRSLGGVSLRELRRSVIDKMAAGNGWVVSDSEQEINGRRVYVVNAQTGTSDGKPQQSWNYYFTQADGRIYSLTTTAPIEYADKMSHDSTQVIGSFPEK